MRGAEGLKVRAPTVKWKRLASTPVPVIASLRGGGFLLITKVTDDKVVVLQPSLLRPAPMMRAEFETVWNGRLVVMTRRRSLSSLVHRLVLLLTNTAEEVRRLAQNIRQSLMRRVSEVDQGDQGPVDAGAESAKTDPTKVSDSGLVALVMLLRCHGIGAESGQIRHRCGTATIGITEMLRCAKELGLKARAPTTNWDRLSSTPLPGIAALRDGGFLILGKVAEDKVLIQHPSSPRPEAMTRAQFETVWDGRLVLMARRAKLSDLTRRFDITWFLGAIHKYRHLLGEVLVISFFLQLFALVFTLVNRQNPFFSGKGQ
jgi:subfamily B ATP-binding cassette protein HlyB/CyaB